MEVYRLILDSPNVPGLVDTGATYPECSRENPEACIPLQATLENALAYARENGEIPVKVYTEQQAWDIIEGKTAITDSMIIKEGDGFFSNISPMMIAAGLAAVFILPRFFKRG